MVDNTIFCLQELISDIRSLGPDAPRPLVLVASHGGFIHALNMHLKAERRCTFPEGSNLRMISPNTGVSSYDVVLDEQNKKIAKMTCTRLYDAKHLEDGLNRFYWYTIKVKGFPF